tara:strand:- start:872 stop:1852 length:981 start_codon:yes stop_codon:yes gene_type:complete
MCTDLYYCDPEEYMEYQTVYHEYDHLRSEEIMKAIGDLSLSFLGSMMLLQFGLVFYNFYKIIGIKNRVPNLYVPKDKKVKIIRGVPGVGKRNYVYYLENELNREFVVIDVNDFFTNGEDYKFDGKKLAEAESDSMNCFMHALKNKDKRIYVIGTFEKKWMYKNYIELAKMSGYEVNVTELECVGTHELKHYNNRSNHEVPYSKSLKAYNSWENDEDAYKRVPYLADNTNLLQPRLPCLITESDNENETKADDKDEFSELPDIKTLEDCPLVREIKYVDIDDESDSEDDTTSIASSCCSSSSSSSSGSSSSEYNDAECKKSYNDVTL